MKSRHTRRCASSTPRLQAQPIDIRHATHTPKPKGRLGPPQRDCSTHRGSRPAVATAPTWKAGQYFGTGPSIAGDQLSGKTPLRSSVVHVVEWAVHASLPEIQSAGSQSTWGLLNVINNHATIKFHNSSLVRDMHHQRCTANRSTGAIRPCYSFQKLSLSAAEREMFLKIDTIRNARSICAVLSGQRDWKQPGGTYKRTPQYWMCSTINLIRGFGFAAVLKIALSAVRFYLHDLFYGVGIKYSKEIPYSRSSLNST